VGGHGGRKKFNQVEVEKRQGERWGLGASQDWERERLLMLRG